MTATQQTDVETAKPYTSQHAKIVRVEVSVGKDDDARTIEDLIAAITQQLTDPSVAAHNVTIHGAHYLIDGKVCMPADYDPAVKGRKPGTYPPSWAGGPTPDQLRKMQQSNVVVLDDDAVDEGEERTFVAPEPTLPVERTPTGRRKRRDAGVKKGPRDAEKKSDPVKMATIEGAAAEAAAKIARGENA